MEFCIFRFGIKYVSSVGIVEWHWTWRTTRDMTESLTVSRMLTILTVDTFDKVQGDQDCVAKNYYLFAKSMVFRSILQIRPNKAGLKCPSMHTYMRTYVHLSTKSFFHFYFLMKFVLAFSCRIVNLSLWIRQTLPSVTFSPPLPKDQKTWYELWWLSGS